MKQSLQTSGERKRRGRGKDWQSVGVAGASGARLLKCQDLSRCDNDDVCADEMLFPDCERKEEERVAVTARNPHNF